HLHQSGPADDGRYAVSCADGPGGPRACGTRLHGAHRGAGARAECAERRASGVLGSAISRGGTAIGSSRRPGAAGAGSTWDSRWSGHVYELSGVGRDATGLCDRDAQQRAHRALRACAQRAARRAARSGERMSAPDQAGSASAVPAGTARLPPREKLIFEYSRSGRGARTQWPEVPAGAAWTCEIPAALRRKSRAALPEVSELDVVRHYTRLSQLNFSIDTHFYPLGSCTMKYNPKVCNAAALLPGFLARHPLAPAELGQGFLACLYELQEMLKAITGMRGVALSPLAGAQGEFAGVAMIRAYHRARGDEGRNEIL